MSSFKNLVPRRAHKERAQPAARVAKHGLLEKRVDYRARARDRNRKALRLKLLREKAAFRNPDEFYHGMISARTHGGRAARTRDDAQPGRAPLAQRSAEHRLLAETQDARYVGVKTGAERAAVAHLRKGLHFVAAAAAAPRRTHVVFADDGEEAARMAAADAEGGPARPAEGGKRTAKGVLRKERARAYRELERHAARSEKLSTVLADLDAEKALLSKGRRYVVRRADPKTGAPAVFRWHQERKR